jgi:hypothetical protein
MKFQVPVTWMMSGTYEVEAKTLAEANDRVLDCESPYDALPKGEYVDESMAVDHDRSKELNDA